MRGMTMILVVYSHIMGFCFGDSSLGYNNIFFLFRLPCFFFISGWLFYKPYAPSDAKPLVRKKFMVQIIPTFIFLLLLAPPPLFFHQLGATKGGYWFTFALFEFFVIWLFSYLPFRKSRYQETICLAIALVISASAFAYDISYARIARNMGVAKDLLGFLSFMTWRYYLFFFLGTLVRRHFDRFLHVLGDFRLQGLLIMLFIITVLEPRSDSFVKEYLRFAFGGVCGMLLVFKFFHTFGQWFARNRVIGRSLQFIGTRTLDIYLLHYFLLPRFLQPYSQRLTDCHSHLLELAVGLALALVVTELSLLVSRIIRLSPFLAKYLFGVGQK